MDENVPVNDTLNFVEYTVCSVDSNESLKRFIETYESLPELWNRENPSYTNKIKKKAALEKLLTIYREIKPQAVIKDVTKKLNTLRSNYRRELNKIKNSIRSSGCGSVEVYKPSSWVFYALQFLGDSVNVAPFIVEIDKNGESQDEGESASNFLQPATSSFTTMTLPPAKKKKIKGQLARQNRLLQVAYDSLSNKNNLPPPEDEYLNVAKVWAYKLKNLDPMQKVMIQKAINDLFFKAEMETLQKNSSKNNIVKNPSPTFPASPPTVITSTPTKSSSGDSTADYFANFIREQSSSAATQPVSSTKFETLSVTVPKPFVYHVELNRPTKLNAFNYQMFSELNDCFKALHKDEDCRVVLLSAAGRLFTAGLDLSSVAGLGQTLAEQDDVARRCKILRELIITYQDGMSAPEKCVKPVISLVHNACIGAGTDLVTAVDIRYCTEDTYFQVKEIDLGMAADVGVLQRLPRIIGNASLANELCLTGRKILAKESLEAGLVSKVFKDKESMMASGLELAESLAQKSPVAIQMIKRNILFSRDHGVDAGLQHIADWNQAMLQSEDFMNAAMALATKSPPPSFSKL